MYLSAYAWLKCEEERLAQGILDVDVKWTDKAAFACEN